MKKINILGVKISKIDRRQTMAAINEFLESQKFHYAVTPNPEIVLEAIRDEELFYIINSADLALPDGFGLKLAAILQGDCLERVAGADILYDILKRAEEKKMKVAVVNFKDGLSSKSDIENALKKDYPALSFICENLSQTAAAVSKDFEAFAPKIVFVNFGAPWQEKFIYHVLRNVKGIRLAIGIGGAFDFLTGRARRAPKFLRRLGLEWFWRLLIKPQRIGRIFNAVVVFSFKVFRFRFINPFFYRANIACLLYRKNKGRFEVLVVERSEERGHWQLPQGGRDGENLMDAGARELREETNCAKFIAKRAFKNIHKYKFGTRKGETSCRADSCRKHTGFKGQKQGLFIAEFTGKDSDIKINFWDHSAWKWVDVDKLVDEVEMIRKRSTQKFLACFDEYIKGSGLES